MIETATLAPKVALLFDRPYVDAHPCFREMAVQFALHGWEVDLLMESAPTHPLPQFGALPIRLLAFQKNRRGLLKTIAMLCLPHRYALVVATPQWALYWAVWASRWGRFSVVCLSDEIYLREEASSSIKKKWKLREMQAHQA